MLTKTILASIRAARVDSRNFGIMVPAMQKASDPIQQLFLDKIRDYKSKSKYENCFNNSQWQLVTLPKIVSINSLIELWCVFFFRRNDSFVDPTPAIQAELQSELDRVAKVCKQMK